MASKSTTIVKQLQPATKPTLTLDYLLYEVREAIFEELDRIVGSWDRWNYIEDENTLERDDRINNLQSLPMIQNHAIDWNLANIQCQINGDYFSKWTYQYKDPNYIAKIREIYLKIK